MRGTQRVTDQNPEGKFQALEKYAKDLNELAQRGKLDPVIGRDEEIRRVIQVLSRRTCRACRWPSTSRFDRSVGALNRHWHWLTNCRPAPASAGRLDFTATSATWLNRILTSSGYGP